MNECRRFFITGKVQGVFFRSSTQKQAKQLQLTGHAINLPDGRVEVVACGEASQLDILEQWLWEGPRAARVDDVHSEIIEWQLFEKFTTG